MPYVIVNGTGDYGVAGHRFKPGATEVNDEALVALVLGDPDLPRWVTVQADRAVTVDDAQVAAPDPEVDAPAPDAPPAAGAPFAVYGGRDGKWYFNDAAGAQSEPLATHDAAEDAARAAEAADRAAREAAAAAAAQAEEAARRRAAEEAAGKQVPTAAEVAEAEKTAPSAADGPAAPGLDDKFDCRADGCAREFDTSSQRDNHERLAHPRQ